MNYQRTGDTNKRKQYMYKHSHTKYHFKQTHIIAISIIIILCSCTSPNNNTFLEKDIITLGTNTIKDQSLSISEMGYNINIVPLETSDSCLLKGNAHIIYVSQSDIFISDSKKIYRFGKDGKFKNTIGIIGNGPMEHNVIYYTSFDSDKDLLYIYDGHKKIITWDFSGIPISETFIESTGYIPIIFRSGNKFYAEKRAYCKNGDLIISLLRLDNNAQKMDSIKISEVKGIAETNYYPASIISKNTDDYYYINPYDLSLYRIKDESITTMYKFNFDDRIPDFHQLGNMEYRKQNGEDFIEILDIVPTIDRIFLLYHTGNNVYAYIIDRTSGKILFHRQIKNPHKGGGLELYKESGIYIWPHISRDNNMYSLVDISDSELISSFGLTDDSVYKIDENSNPCLIVMTAK